MTKVWISKSNFDFINLEMICNSPNETGGVLLGYWASENEAIITNVIGPGPRAVHRPYYFIPDDKYHRDEIAKLYKESGRRHTYLGDWHTHPEASAYLSSKDKKTLKRIARHRESRMPTPLMAILGTEEPNFKIWKYQPPKSRLIWVSGTNIPCEVYHFDDNAD